MTSIFHQNMRNYGGGSWIRNALFDIDFAGINAATGNCYAAAGFTEIRNNGAGQNFAARAAVLDPGLTSSILIETGITAVGAQVEYLGIAWDPACITVQHAGNVMYNAVQRRWECHDTPAPFPASIPLPYMKVTVGGKRRYEPEAQADSRGLAYIAGPSWGGVNRIFAFMHNMCWLGDKSSAFTKLDDMVAAIDAALPYAATAAYAGGDFNVLPRDPGGALLHHAAGLDATNTYYLNTTAANPFDFWLSDQAAINHARATVWNGTLHVGASDHAGIKLVV